MIQTMDAVLDGSWGGFTRELLHKTGREVDAKQRPELA
jgi:hypothetical protein